MTFTILAPEQIAACEPRPATTGRRSIATASTRAARTCGGTATARGGRSPSGSSTGRCRARSPSARRPSAPRPCSTARAPSAERSQGRRAAAGAVRVGRRALGPPQEVRRSHARVRDATSRRQRHGIEVTNLGAYLERHPPTWEARLAPGPDGEGTAWSCAHGLGRWRRDCGCNMRGARAGTRSGAARCAPALDLVRDAAARLLRGRRRRAAGRSLGRARRLRRGRRRADPDARRRSGGVRAARARGRRRRRRATARACCSSCSARRCSCTRAAPGSSTTSRGSRRRW